MGSWVFINDEFVTHDDARLHYTDLSIQRGYGVFDFFKVIKGHPVFLDDHLNRFQSSAEEMRLALNLSRYDLVSVIHLLIKKNNLRDCGIRLTLTGGNSPDGYRLSAPNLIIAAQALTYAAKEDLKKGLRLVSYSHQRQLPNVKTIDYLMPIYLQPLLAKHSADDILYHQNGVITECPRSNFFVVSKDATIITPANNILKGVTRMKIKELVPDLQEADITLDDLRDAQAAFVTSTTKMVFPVHQVDQIVFPDCYSSATQKLAGSLQLLIETGV